MFTVWTDGGLTLNFGWHHGSEAARAARDRLKSEVERLKLCQVPPNYADQFVDVATNEWVPRVDELIEAVKRITEAQ